MLDFLNRGVAVALSSPSGAGKSSLSRALLEKESPHVTLSISVTTRAPRPGEINGIHYFFVSHEVFSELIARGELLEFAKVFGYYYGTPRKAIEAELNAGKDVLFDIDWQGTQQLRERIPDLVSIFILPPSMTELERRLNVRAQDNEEVVAQRMSKAADEMSHWAEYEYVVINEDWERSLMSLQSILEAERLKRTRQGHLSEFVKKLRQGQ